MIHEYPQIMIVDRFCPKEIIKKIELAGRTCYQSKTETKDPNTFIQGLGKRGHTSVLEHATLSFRIKTDRGISHELVRHRIASYSQESTRYCKYGDDVVFIKHLMPEVWDFQESVDKKCEKQYQRMLDDGLKPEIARQALNNNVKTEIYVTMNMRSLRNFFTLRCDSHAHPYMREIAIPFLLEMKDQLPALFEDIPYDEGFYEKYLKNFLEEHPIVIYNNEYKCD
jgi:thymidylate synthase (FAD)